MLSSPCDVSDWAFPLSRHTTQIKYEGGEIMLSHLNLAEFMKRWQLAQEELPVYRYVKSHPCSCVRDCAQALGLTEIAALEFFNSLMKKGRLRVSARPLDCDCHRSCYYSAC